MRKFRKVLAILMILSALCLLLGCTPEEEGTKPTDQLPTPTEPQNPAPTAQNGTAPELNGTGEARTPEGSGEAGTPAGTGEELPAPEDTTEEEEIISGYTIEIDENYGVGGN